MPVHQIEKIFFGVGNRLLRIRGVRGFSLMPHTRPPLYSLRRAFRYALFCAVPTQQTFKKYSLPLNGAPMGVGLWLGQPSSIGSKARLDNRHGLRWLFAIQSGTTRVRGGFQSAPCPPTYTPRKACVTRARHRSRLPHQIR